jgi:hypothetical protein
VAVGGFTSYSLALHEPCDAQIRSLVDVPGVFWYSPFVHTSMALHLTMPLTALYVLAGHGTHLPGALVESPVSCWPGGQGLNTVQFVAYVPELGLKVPLGQFLHAPGLLSKIE